MMNRKTMKLMGLLAAGCLTWTATGCTTHSAPLSENLKAIDRYSVVWDSPSLNSLGNMPMGNGDLGINLWVEENGDLQFYLSKTDAWSENGRLLKLGKVRLQLSPNPFRKGQKYRQELKVKDGVMYIDAGEGKDRVAVNVWIDAFNPAVELSVESEQPISAKVATEPWRTERRLLKGIETHSAYGPLGDIYVEKDSILPPSEHAVAWMHRNARSIWKDNLELQKLDHPTAEDPLLNRTFGCLLTSDEMQPVSPTLLATDKPVRQLCVTVYAYTAQTPSVAQWVAGIDSIAQHVDGQSDEKRLEAHKDWWNRMWERSYIHFATADTALQQQVEHASRMYALQRYMNICAGRGQYPIKFNGSIFTVDTKHLEGRFQGFDADYRQWGGAYWWQNTRLPYWSMLKSGDFDMMRPLFAMYRNTLETRKEATRKYYNHDGAFYPETMYFWGTYVDENYGGDRTGMPDGLTQNTYIRYYWQGGLELSLMMLDYYQYTQDTDFLKDTLLPVATEVVTFFDQHWKRGDDGKILFSPAMSLETYRTAVNPLPEIVGIHKVCSELLRLPDSFVSDGQRSAWKRLMSELPEIPVEERNGVKVLAPAYLYKDKQNVENPELYAIFPYRRYAVGKEGLDLARNTFANRAIKETGGWQQNAIKAACLGLTDEAARLMLQNFNTKNEAFRFPTMWGPNYDWIPDQDHGTVAMSALQSMLLQCDGTDIHLFPAWPRNWDVSFKLCAPGNTQIEGVYKNGKLERLVVTPKEREKDIRNWLE